jgi:uncharacterized membrane protein YkgB
LRLTVASGTPSLRLAFEKLPVTTPGVAKATAGGFPAISALPGQFLLKDLVLLAASLNLLVTSLPRLFAKTH